MDEVSTSVVDARGAAAAGLRARALTDPGAAEGGRESVVYRRFFAQPPSVSHVSQPESRGCGLPVRLIAEKLRPALYDVDGGWWSV